MLLFLRYHPWCIEGRLGPHSPAGCGRPVTKGLQAHLAAWDRHFPHPSCLFNRSPGAAGFPLIPKHSPLGLLQGSLPVRKLSESGSGGWLVACVPSHFRGSFLVPKVAHCLHGLSWILGAGPLLQPSPPNWSPILRPLRSLRGLCIPALCRSLG